MKKRTLYKDIKRTIFHSFGRFLSITSLIALGTFGMVGLYVSGPNIEKTVQDYTTNRQLADLFVIGEYGLSQHDQDELQSIAGVNVEFGYFTDATINQSAMAVRVFSLPQILSTPELIQGSLPMKTHEIAVSYNLTSHYAIGDTIKLTENNGKNILKEKNFTITGFVNSGEFISKTALGASQAGSGTLTAFAFTLTDTFQQDVYTLARLRYHDSSTLFLYGRPYEQLIASHQATLENLLSDNGPQRLTYLKQSTQEKLMTEQQNIIEAKAQLQDAEKQLQDTHSTLSEREKDITNGEQLLHNNQQTLVQVHTSLMEAEKTLSSTKQQLDNAKQQLADGKAQLNQTLTTLNNGKQQLEHATIKIQQKENALKQAKLQLSESQQHLIEGKQTLEQQENALNQAKQLFKSNPELALQQGITEETLQRQSGALLQARVLLNEQEKRYQGAVQDYQTGESMLRTGRQTLIQQKLAYEHGVTQYKRALTLWEEKEQTYQTGLTKYEQGLTTYQEKKQLYLASIQRFEQEQAKLANAKQQITQAWHNLTVKQTDFNQQKQTAENNITTGQQKINQAQEKLNHLEQPNYSVYTRQTMLGSEGYQTIKATAQGITSVGNMFPVVLYAVAALVTFTTITRFVNDERAKSGLFKALGYTNQDILKKFVLYGVLSGTLGTVIGALGGLYLLPIILGQTLLADTILPPIHLGFYPFIVGMAFICSLCCSTLPALWVVQRELQTSTANLLLPKPPSTKGSTILLERLTPIWKRLSFTQKVTARNLFRYKQRMLMTIFGVAGSVALLFSGLGIISSLSGMTERQYGDIIQYDALVVTQTPSNTLDTTTDEQINADTSTFNQRLEQADIEKKMAIFSENFTKKMTNQDDQTVTLLVANKTFDGFIQLFDSQNKQPLKLPDNGVIISEKLAKLLQVTVGSTFTLEKNNQSYTLTVSGISELYAGHFIFAQQTAYQTIFKTVASPNAYLLSLSSKNDQSIQTLASELMKLSTVKTVVQNTAMVYRINQIVNSLKLVMIVLTVASILLAVVILYNLTTINVAERIREISTIKVLGFYHNETTLYIYRETILLSLIGIGFGLLFGKLLHHLIIETVATPMMMFNPHVELWVYVLPTLIIVCLLLALGLTVNHLLKRINMLEALKSVD